MFCQKIDEKFLGSFESAHAPHALIDSFHTQSGNDDSGGTTTSPREDTGRSVRVVGRVFVIGRSGRGAIAVKVHAFPAAGADRGLAEELGPTREGHACRGLGDGSGVHRECFGSSESTDIVRKGGCRDRRGTPCFSRTNGRLLFE